jgi:hypothetical protein
MFKGEQESRLKTMMKKGKAVLNEIKEHRVL